MTCTVAAAAAAATDAINFVIQLQQFRMHILWLSFMSLDTLVLRIKKFVLWAQALVPNTSLDSAVSKIMSSSRCPSMPLDPCCSSPMTLLRPALCQQNSLYLGLRYQCSVPLQIPQSARLCHYPDALQCFQAYQSWGATFGHQHPEPD